jgi:hypothetical protein
VEAVFSTVSMPHTLPKHNCAVQRLRSRGEVRPD